MRAESEFLVETMRSPVVLLDFCQAREVCEAVSQRTYLHAGPPTTLGDLSGPSQGALVGALLFEGQAETEEEARAIIAAGNVALLSCHSVGAVGALAGVVTPSTPVAVVQRANGRRSFAPLNEGLGSALRFGNYDPETLRRLVWMRDVLTPTLRAALVVSGPIDVVELQCEGLRRGDECHNRNVASMAQWLVKMAPAIVRSAPSPAVAAEVLDDLAENVQFFLALSMATAKAIADDIQSGPIPGLVTAIASNGTEIGIRVSGSDRDWFTGAAPGPGPSTQMRPGFEPADAGSVLGDSAVTETIGLGALALSSAPRLARTFGLGFAEATRVVARMRRICIAENPRYRLPVEDERGTPYGISVHRVVDEGITPVFSGGFAHRLPGRGPVGAGLIEVPMAPFSEAMAALAAGPGPGRASHASPAST